jgi:hypothetical protein
VPGQVAVVLALGGVEGYVHGEAAPQRTIGLGEIELVAGLVGVGRRVGYTCSRP